MISKNYKKGVLVLVGLLIVGVFFFLDLHTYLNLEFIKSSQHAFAVAYDEKPVLVPLLFFLAYTIVAALSLPGAAIMTVASGALLGLFKGVVIVSFASTIGATLACFVSRYLLRDWVQSKFGEKLETINQGVIKEGGFYLFTMRLIPAFPFFLVNLAMGLTKMKLTTFFWVSQIGMLPGTIVFINAGKELSKIDSLAGVLSPPLILSFIALGIFPLVAKKSLSMFKKHRSEASGEEHGKI